MINHRRELTVPAAIEFTDSDRELSYRVELEDTVIARDLISALRFGHLAWLSPSFKAGDTSRSSIDGVRVTNIDAVETLPELSAVRQPAQVVISFGIEDKDRHGRPTDWQSIARDRVRLQHFL